MSRCRNYAKDIPGFEGIYYATRDGEIYRHGRKKPLKPQSFQGTMVVSLYKNRKKKFLSLTRIVSMCFFQNLYNRFEHINGDKKDFAFKNLAPITPIGTLGKNRKRPVVRIKNGEVTFYGSIKECAKSEKCSTTTIGRYLRTKQSRAGTIFMYEDKYFSKHQDEYTLDRSDVN